MTVCMGYPAKTRKGEPENAAGKGQEHHAERTAPNIWNYDDTQNRNYQFLKIKFTMWYNFFNGLQQKTGSITSAFYNPKPEVRPPKNSSMNVLI